MNFGKEYYEYCKKENNFDMNSLGGWQERYFEFLLDVFKTHIKNGSELLDVGCGTGVYPEVANNFGYYMAGCDVSDWYVENTPFVNITDRLGVIKNNKIPFESDSFNFVQMCQVIEHIPEKDIVEELNDIKRVMCSGGILYISTVGEGPAIPAEGEDPTHISCFSEEKWNKIFDECGFINVSEKYRKLIAKNDFSNQYDWVNFILLKK